MDELDEEGAERRALASRRSISLGRVRASRRGELLARKMASTGDTGELQLEPRESRSAHRLAGGHHEANGDSLFGASSAEAKLQSLSEQLRLHQNNQQQRDSWQLDSANGTDSSSRSPTSTKSIDDIYILLAKKEKDLQLAAELGKVLLEKNDELSKANERITEDYTHKLEVSSVLALRA